MVEGKIKRKERKRRERGGGERSRERRKERERRGGGGGGKKEGGRVISRRWQVGAESHRNTRSVWGDCEADVQVKDKGRQR